MTEDITTLDVKLTTYDNPYNPFVDWDAWYKWDQEHGYCTPELISRYIYGQEQFINVESMDDDERDFLEARAINKIIDEGPFDNVWTVVKPTTKTPIRLPTK